jgi:integrase
VLSDSRTSTNHFLRCLHNLAVGLGWLPWPLIPPKLWPKATSKKRCAITVEEHQRIITAEGNVERRHFYSLLWEIGAAQTDTAMLTAERIDWTRRVLSFRRCKTGAWAHFVIGERLEQLLKQLPVSGPLFPTIAASNASARSAQFCRRCRLLEIKGIGLHSYRYAWAERAKTAGYPARWAQDALGHNSRAVHETYADGVLVLPPPLEDFALPTSLGSGKRAQPDPFFERTVSCALSQSMSSSCSAITSRARSPSRASNNKIA